MDSKRVIFLCTGNSCRSQMAEGWLRHLDGDRFEAASAGTRPSSINTNAIKVMSEVGVDLSNHTSDGIDRYLNEDWDLLVTVCDNARESCPAFPGAKQSLHWSLEDPAEAQGTEEERLAFFRRIRDEIAKRIKGEILES